MGIDKLPRIFFTVTPGRSGTKYLAQELNRLPGVCSVHEPEPGFHGRMREALSEPSTAVQFLREVKLPSIAEKDARVYIETSHVFCKGFFQPLISLGIVSNLILLSRDKRKVAKSLYKIGTIPGRSDVAHRWYLSPDDPSFLFLPDWQNLHDYQLCYWYCLEIERRQKIFGGIVRSLGGTVVRTTLSRLRSLTGYISLILRMRIPMCPPKELYRHWYWNSRRVNTKKHEKQPSRSIDECECQPLEEEVHGIRPTSETCTLSGGRNRNGPCR